MDAEGRRVQSVLSELAAEMAEGSPDAEVTRALIVLWAYRLEGDFHEEVLASSEGRDRPSRPAA